MLLQTQKLADKGRFLMFLPHIPTTQKGGGKFPGLGKDRENTVSWVKSQGKRMPQAKGMT